MTLTTDFHLVPSLEMNGVIRSFFLFAFMTLTGTTLYFLAFKMKQSRIILVNDQLDAQLLYFVTRLLQSSTCFEQYPAHHQEV